MRHGLCHPARAERAPVIPSERSESRDLHPPVIPSERSESRGAIRRFGARHRCLAPVKRSSSVIPSERSESRDLHRPVIPSERSESRDLHVWFLTESAETTEDTPPGRAPRPGAPCISIHDPKCLDRPAERSLPPQAFSAIAALSVSNPGREGAIRPFQI